MSKPQNPIPNAYFGQAIRRAAAAAIVAAPILLGMDVPAPAASAQPLCGERSQVLSDLAQRNGERPKAIGLSASGTLVEVLVSPSGDWTILVTYPSRETCLVATGAHWMSVPIAADPAA